MGTVRAWSPGRAYPGFRARRVLFARVLWAGVAVLALTVFVAGIPPFAAELQTPCAGAGCTRYQPSPGFARALGAAGLSPHAYAAYYITCEALYLLGFWAVGLALAWCRTTDPLALLGAVALTAFGTAFTNSQYALIAAAPGWRWPIAALGLLGASTLFTFFFLFPDGRFFPRWTRAAAPAWAVCCALGYFAPSA